MMRLLTVVAAVSLALSVTHLVATPFGVATVAVAAALLYQLVNDLAGTGGARVAVALLLASFAPTLSSALPIDLELSTLATLSLPWWLPLLAGIAMSPHHRSSPATIAVGAWWALTATVALTAPAPWGAMAMHVETAAAAALAGMAVASLVEASQAIARRRAAPIAALTATCVWQAWLVLGMGRPARLLVPMLAAALMIAAADLLTEEPAAPRDKVGAALVVAMLVLGLVPGAHLLVAQHRALATRATPVAPVSGAESPSSIAAP